MVHAGLMQISSLPSIIIKKSISALLAGQLDWEVYSIKGYFASVHILKNQIYMLRTNFDGWHGNHMQKFYSPDRHRK